MLITLAKGVPVEVVIDALNRVGLTVTVEGDSMRVRWNPRYAHDGEAGNDFVPAFLRYVSGRDYDL